MLVHPTMAYIEGGDWPRARLCVIIVTYNSVDTLPGLLDSLPAGLAGVDDAEVVVVDNGSTDNSVTLAQAHPIVDRVIATGRNAGYAAGINVGSAGATTNTDILVLNPDIRVLPGAILPLVESLRDPDVGIAAPRIEHEGGELSLSLRREPSLVTAWSDALLFGRLASHIDLGEIIHVKDRYTVNSNIDWASGAALAIAARARRVGGRWDERYFLYSEEVEFQRRVRKRGLSVRFVATSRMVHIGGDYQSNPRLYEILTANRIHDYARQHGFLKAGVFRLAVIVGETLRSLGGSPVHVAGLRAALRRWTPYPETTLAASRIGSRM